jgi:transglutaminase-like putative cysteine protease
MSLDPARALNVALYVLVADGLAALWLGDLLGTPGLVLVGLLVVGSCWQEALRAWLGRVPGLGALVVTLALGGAAVEIAWLAPTMLDGFTHLLVVLLLYRLYTRRNLQDVRDVAFVAFFMLVAVSALTFSVAFLGLFLVFLVVGTWLLMARHVLAETSRVPSAPPAATLRRDLVRLAAVAAAATLAVTALLFFVIPRVGHATLPLRATLGRMVSGFAERVELGAFGEIETDSTVVMRVRLPDWPAAAPSPATLPDLRWRGVAFERFDGRTWVAGQPRRAVLRRQTPGPVALDRYRGGPLLAQEVFLEPLGSEAIFGAPRLVRLDSRAHVVTVDDLGNVGIPSAAARLHYTVESEPEPRGAGLARGPRVGPLDPAARRRYTQLPPIAPRVAALARQVAAGSAGPWEAARRLTAHLEREYAYTRALERRTTLDPVEEFLFVSRKGNCEYFAAALAVLLRSLDVPARVVNGFQRGEWNPYGQYFMVRLSDAHSWVEVFVDGAGWLTLDPSPRAGAEPVGAPTAATLYLDALRMRWYRYVISWSLHDQLLAALTVRRTAASWGAWRPAWPDARDATRLALGAVVLALAVAAFALRRRAAAAREPTPRVPRFYAVALEALARRRLRPAAGETAREFVGRVGRVAPDCGAPFARLTHAYERVRFGGGALGPAEAVELDACVARLVRGR